MLINADPGRAFIAKLTSEPPPRTDQVVADVEAAKEQINTQVTVFDKLTGAQQVLDVAEMILNAAGEVRAILGFANPRSPSL